MTFEGQIKVSELSTGCITYIVNGASYDQSLYGTHYSKSYMAFQFKFILDDIER